MSCIQYWIKFKDQRAKRHESSFQFIKTIPGCFPYLSHTPQVSWAEGWGLCGYSNGLLVGILNFDEPLLFQMIRIMFYYCIISNTVKSHRNQSKSTFVWCNYVNMLQQTDRHSSSMPIWNICKMGFIRNGVKPN